MSSGAAWMMWKHLNDLKGLMWNGWGSPPYCILSAGDEPVFWSI
jgi:hypothetical protein